MKHLLLTRKSYLDSTRGTLICMNGNKVDYVFETLELPWKDNETRISCIPPGIYPVAIRKSEKYKTHLHIKDVPNRSLILIHWGNFLADTNGCVLVGMTGDDNEVWRSKEAFNLLMEWFDQDTTITIS